MLFLNVVHNSSRGLAVIKTKFFKVHKGAISSSMHSEKRQY